jgi:hypothetical protein
VAAAGRLVFDGIHLVLARGEPIAPGKRGNRRSRIRHESRLATCTVSRLTRHVGSLRHQTIPKFLAGLHFGYRLEVAKSDWRREGQYEAPYGLAIEFPSESSPSDHRTSSVYPAFRFRAKGC